VLKEIKIKDKKTLLVSVLMIIFIIFLTFWRVKTGESSLSSSEFSVPEERDEPLPTSIEDFISDEEIDEIAKEVGLSLPEKEKDIEYKRKEIAGKIRFDYPSSWEVSKEAESEEKVEQLFFAFSTKNIFPGAFTVIKVNAKDIEEFSDIIKEGLEKEGQLLDFELTKESKEEYFLKTVSQHKGVESASQGKIYFLENNFYMASVNYFKNDMSIHPDIIDYIVSSIQIIN